MGVLIFEDKRRRIENVVLGMNTPRMSSAWTGMGEKSSYYS